MATFPVRSHEQVIKLFTSCFTKKGYNESDFTLRYGDINSEYILTVTVDSTKHVLKYQPLGYRDLKDESGRSAPESKVKTDALECFTTSAGGRRKLRKTRNKRKTRRIRR
jgi:hypothetical protein